MLRPQLVAVLVLAASLACTVTTGKPDADEPKPNTSADADADADADPKSDAVDPEPEQATKPERAPIPAAELPECPAAADGRTVLAIHCTEDGKLAGSWVPVDTLKVPDDVEIIFNAEGPDASNQTSLTIAVRGDELYIRQVTCGACRRVLGQGFAGHLSHLSAEQIRAVETTLGLGDDAPVLASAEAWTSFAAGEQGKAALTELAAPSEAEAEAEADGRGR